MWENGVDAVMVVTPSYYKGSMKVNFVDEIYNY